MSYTLLLADDSVTTHRVMELTFAGEDVRVVSVADGELALDRMRTTRPDILVAEVALPRVGGYKLAEHVRSSPALSGMPVLLLTGAFDVVDESRVHACGAAGIIVKPFEPEFVIKRVKELLGIAGGGNPQSAGMRLVTPAAPPSPQPGVAQRRVGPSAVAPEATNTTAALADFPAAEPEPSSIDATAPQLGPAGSSETAGQAASGSDDYLEQLDAAFDQVDQRLPGTAARASEPSAAAPESVVATSAPPLASLDAPVVEIDQEWFDGNLAVLTSASKSGAGPFVPDVADTFQALLAAEQGEAALPPVHEPLVLSDDMIERIATRVAERLSEGVLADTVRSVVENVAERLVREEIARIRSKVEARKS